MGTLNLEEFRAQEAGPGLSAQVAGSRQSFTGNPSVNPWALDLGPKQTQVAQEFLVLGGRDFGRAQGKTFLDQTLRVVFLARPKLGAGVVPATKNRSLF